MTHSNFFVANFLWRYLLGSTPNVAARYVDKTNIDQAKAEARKVQNDDFFVSTNDILVSSFAMEAGSDVLLMPFNLRGRHDHVKDSSAGVKDSSAGNYEHVLYYDGKDSYGDPEHIRNSLRQGPPYRRVNPKAMPNWRKRMTSDYSMITSWAFSFFHADRHLWNSAGKPNTSSLVKLHLPLYDRKEIVPQPFGVIFKPCKDKLAVMYFYAPKNNCYARLVAKGTVLGGAARSMKKCLFD